MRPWRSSNSSEQAAQFQALVEIIRTEIRVGVDPLRGDISNLKSAVDDIRRQQQAMYSREVMDLKLKERDDSYVALKEDLKEVRNSVSSLSSTLGGYWKQLFITASIILSPIGAAVSLWFSFHH